MSQNVGKQSEFVFRRDIRKHVGLFMESGAIVMNAETPPYLLAIANILPFDSVASNGVYEDTLSLKARIGVTCFTIDLAISEAGFAMACLRLSLNSTERV